MKSSSPFRTGNDESERLQVTGEWITSFAENVFPGWSGQVASNDGEESIENGSSRVSTLPTGAGFLWGRREILEDMPAYMGGGEMIADVFLDHSTYTELPHKFEAGAPAIGEFVGFGAAIEYLKAIGMDDIHRILSV